LINNNNKKKINDIYIIRDNFINNEEIKYFLKYKPQTWVVLKKIKKEKKDELTQLENKVSKMNIDMDIDSPNVKTNTNSNSNTNENSNNNDNSNTSEPSSSSKPVTTSNVLIELENTLNNYEIDYQQLEKKKGPLIVDLSEEGQSSNSNELKTDTNNTEKASPSNDNENENEMFKSTSTFNLANASKDSLFQSQDSINKTQRPLIIELDSNNGSTENINMDTQKTENSSPSNLNIVNDNANKVQRLDENVEWIEKIPMVKSLDGSIPINKVMNELKPSTEPSSESQMQIDEEKLDSFFKFTEEENRMMTNLPNIECN